MSNQRIGVALSGGGYRAAAFHLGTLRALNRLGVLSKVDVISSVSGGSILAAYYGLHKNEVFESWEKDFKKKLHRCSLWGFVINLILAISLPIVLSVFFSAWFLLLFLMLIPLGFTLIPSSKWIALAYDRIFFDKKKLKDFPESPIIGINSTNLVNGRLFTFSRQDVGGYDYKEDGKSIILGEEIPISFAVSCSTCVPTFFSPRKIKRNYFLSGKYRDNMLVDGGLYDNQGAYILSESSNKLYQCDDILVSDAGNSEPSNKLVVNTIALMNQSIEVLMNRIRTLQIRKNIYHYRDDINGDDPRFAYLSLRWTDLINIPNRFIINIKKGFVDPRTLSYHQISKEDVELLRKGDENVREEIARKFEKSINWSDLVSRMPSEDTHKKAYSVRTNLTPLSNKKIDSLASYADWLTELQIKTYLPHILTL